MFWFDLRMVSISDDYPICNAWYLIQRYHISKDLDQILNNSPNISRFSHNITMTLLIVLAHRCTEIEDFEPCLAEEKSQSRLLVERDEEVLVGVSNEDDHK